MRRLLLAVLFLAIFPAAADPIVFTGDRELSRPEIGPALGRKSSPFVATDGENYLAAWTDERSGLWSVWGARFSADGALLDPTGFRLAENGRAKGVTWTGGSYLVVYTQPSTERYLRVALYAQPVSPAGVAGPAIRLADELEEREPVVTATNGSTTLIVAGAREAMLVDRDGKGIRSVPLPDKSAYGVAVTAVESGFLVVMNGWAMPINANGIAGPLQRSLCRGGVVALASDGARVLAVSASSREVRILTAQGVPAGPCRPLIDANQRLTSASVTWRGDEYYAIVASDDGRGSAVRLSSEGVLLDEVTFGLPLDSWSGSIDVTARGDGSGAAVWSSEREGVSAGLFDEDSIAGPYPYQKIVTLTRSARRQASPQLARDAHGTVVGWEECAGGRCELRLSRPGGIPVVVSSESVWSFDVFVNGDGIWVVWAEARRLLGQAYDAALRPRFAQPLVIGEGADIDESPHNTVASPRALLVTYMTPDGRWMKAIVTRDGVRADEFPELTSFGDFVDDLTSQWNGTEFVVGWTYADFNATTAPEEGVAAMRIGEDGTPLDTRPADLSDRGNQIDRLSSVPVEGGIALAWQESDWSGPAVDQTYATVFRPDQTPVIEYFGDRTDLLGFAQHGGGFLLLQGIRRQLHSGDYSRIEALSLDANLRLEEVGTSHFEVSRTAYRSIKVVDLLGGPSPLIAYVRPTQGPEYGGIGRIFLRSAEGGR